VVGGQEEEKNTTVRERERERERERSAHELWRAICVIILPARALWL
jgi:hypothetical protein